MSVLFLFFAVFASVAQADPVCLPDRAACLETKVFAGEMEFWAESNSPCSLTLSLEQETENLGDVPEKITFTLGKAEKKKLFGAKVRNSARPWRQSFRYAAQCGSMSATPEDYPYSLPVRFEEGVYLSQGFHGRFSHRGAANRYATDFAAPEGTPVYASRPGMVVQVVDHFERGGPLEPPDNANVIRIEHKDHTVAEYAHLQYRGAAVKEGQALEAGDLIGYSGNTGRSTGPHLHFAVHMPIDGKFRKSIPMRFRSKLAP